MLDGDELKKQSLKTCKLEKKMFDLSVKPMKHADGYVCPKCQNRRVYMVIYERNGLFYTGVGKCECTKSEEIQRHLKKSGLDGLLTKTFSNFKVSSEWQQKMKDLAIENIKCDEWFYIGGNSGAGKTHICSAIANNLIAQGRTVKYSVWIEDMQELKSMANDIEYKEKIDKLKDADVLYIDDLFKARNKTDITAADIRITFDIINRRDLNKKKTIISSELTLKEVDRVDEAIAGRIAKSSGRYILNLGKDSSRNQRYK